MLFFHIFDPLDGLDIRYSRRYLATQIKVADVNRRVKGSCKPTPSSLETGFNSQVREKGDWPLPLCVE